ncbi:hypothetical protein FOFC_00051 [Fusarium oxysporum]|nr:hypothetical protein FOFC_00051 [Fusarium oxysporum]
MREGFEIGTWHKIIGGKCDEEVVRYMEFTLESWVKLMGSKEALLYVDTEDVKEFQLRVPGVSQVDYRYLADLVEGGIAFRRLTDTAERSQILHRMKNINYLLPSIYTLQKDFKYLRLCTDTMKRLLHGKRKIPLTVQVLAYDAFSQKDPIEPENLFFKRLKRLYLYIMQDLVELTGEWPLLEDGEEPPEASFRNPMNWHRLAQKARRLGFESDEIRRLAVTNPDEQIAFKALQDARPSSWYQGPSLRVFFPIGSVPTRSMIAFFRDRDPAGRSEPEGMESTSPSTNDVDVLSSSTLAVASLATPAPSLQEETPHEEVEHQYLWRCFPDYVWSQRVRDTPSWVWGFGYDVEDSSGGRRWVCRRCIQNKNPKPRSFAEKGIQNANAHLFKGHGIRAPPDKTKSAAEKKAEKLKVKDQRSIAEVMKLDTRLPREQDIANSLVKGFDRKHFQRLLLEWIIEENHAFSVCEQGRLRQIFEYLNPLVKITDANITRTTIRRKVLSAYEMHKDKVVAALKQSCGLIHVSFDGWKSGNRHSLYGIACFFRDENSQPRKLALGVPELRTRHFGHNIAAEILDVLDAYGIQDKIGYFTLDNAESNDKAMEVIGGELGFVGSRRRGRCFGHTLNLSAKALLFGHNVEAFEEQLSGEAALSEAEHTLWRRKGPVGKLHNLVVDVRRSDQLTYLLRSIQRSEFDLSSDPRIRARQPVDLIIDNDTRWLSQLYMIRRAIILRPFIEQLVLKHRQQWEQDNRSKRTGNLRKSAREPRICLEENQLTVNDWVVLEHLAKLLGFYEDAVKTLEGDGQQRKRKGGWVGSYGNVWEVIQGFEFLLEVLEDYKQLASEIPDAEHFRINVNLGWEKLNKYYSRLDETPIYYTALALHPAFRWGYFENEWKDNTEWVMKAKQMVREVWESDYRHLQVVRSPVDDEPVAKRQRKYYNPFQAYCERTRPVLGYGLVKEEATLSDDINEDTNELELWQSSWEDGDNDVRDPISYWHERKRRYPRLSRMALDFLTIQPMSAECERMFAAAGRMVTPLRNRLDADIIGMCQVLRSWLRAGVIDDLDVSLLPTENGSGDRAEEGS